LARDTNLSITAAHARRSVGQNDLCLAHPLLRSPPSLAPVCCLAAAFSVHTIALLTRELLADWKALLPPSLAAPKRHAHRVDARGQALDSLSARRPEDCDPVRSPPDGPSSAALALLLAVGARRAVKAKHLRPCLNGLVSTVFSHLAHSLREPTTSISCRSGSRQCCRIRAQAGCSLGLHQDRCANITLARSGRFDQLSDQSPHNQSATRKPVVKLNAAAWMPKPRLFLAANSNGLSKGSMLPKFSGMTSYLHIRT
jgi:hypothetical protein